MNESGGPYEMERVRVNVSVAYGTDINKAKQILMDIASTSKEVCNDPTPRVRFRELGDSGLIFQLLFWIEKPEMRGRVIDSVNGMIYERFRDENIEIPFPQQTIHIKKTSDEYICFQRSMKSNKKIRIHKCIRRQGPNIYSACLQNIGFLIKSE